MWKSRNSLAFYERAFDHPASDIDNLLLHNAKGWKGVKILISKKKKTNGWASFECDTLWRLKNSHVHTPVYSLYSLSM